MPIKIALAGNPNCGKTTMFNDLTGSSQYVGNWPGVTVEKKEGRLRGQKDVTVVDLPGIYSLSPYTLEEVVTRNFLVNDKPDVIINIVDASNLERNLYLTTQLVEVGIPVVIALNMMDVVKKSGDYIDVKLLSARLGCDVIETSAVKGLGNREAAQRAIQLAQGGKVPQPRHSFSKDVDSAISSIASILKEEVPAVNAQWYAIKLFERDEKVQEQITLSDSAKTRIAEITAVCEKVLDDDSESIVTNQRYEYISNVVKDCLKKKHAGHLTTSDRIDRVVTNRWLALPIFAAIIFLIYFISVTTVGALVTDWVNDVFFGTWVMEGAAGLLSSIGAADWLIGLVVDGIIGGVGAVLGFVPQMLILFFFLSILEDSGYMARVAFIMDRIFRRFGLSGKSFIPILISTGCSVPAIMATRTIENEKDRKMTIILSSFMPCSAKMVIIAMITTIFFADSAWIASSMYFLGIAVIILSGIILKKTRPFLGDPAPFVMELPPYHLPSVKGVLIHMWERSKAFIIKAGTIIFIASGVIWFLSSFGWSLQLVEDAEESILATLGHGIAWFFAPLGFGDWKGAVATISALIAKENAISTLAVLNGVADPDNAVELTAGIASMFTQLGALSFLLFNLFSPPCFAAIGATAREMGSAKWTFIALGYQIMLGYSIAFVVNQLGGMLFFGASFGVGPAIAMAVVAAVIFLVVRPSSGGKTTLKSPRVKVNA